MKVAGSFGGEEGLLESGDEALWDRTGKGWLSSNVDVLRKEEHFDFPALSSPARVLVCDNSGKGATFFLTDALPRGDNFGSGTDNRIFSAVPGRRCVAIFLGELL